MPYTPRFVTADSFQEAWSLVASILVESKWELRNLMVHIKNPILYDEERNALQNRFASDCGILAPKQVAYTIFPHNLYKNLANKDADKLFDLYNRKRGLYDKLHYLKPNGWGTYFRRMTHYEEADGSIVNQLKNVIDSAKENDTYKAAHTIIIQKPAARYLRGGPCLNYIALQCDKIDGIPSLGLLAVYRNHDFLERAYGNYLGLCNLQQFVAKQVGRECGPLTCISSRAYVDDKKCNLKDFLASLKLQP